METWDKLGAASTDSGALGLATQDTAVSVPPLARSLTLSFDEYGSNIPALARAQTYTQEVVGAIVAADPLSSLPVAPGTVDLTPANKRGSNSAGRQAKKTAGRKPAPKTVVTVVVATLGGELGEALGKADVGSKARRSKATPVTPRAPSARAKAKLGELTSLESAKLRLADKNL